MSTEHPYIPLGYPVMNLPRPGQPVSTMMVHDTVYPLLRGVKACIIALGVSIRTGDLDSERASWGLALMEGQIETALHVLQRWEDTQKRRTQEPASRTNGKAQEEEDDDDD